VGEPFFEPRKSDIHHDEPRAFCMPGGYAMQFVQTKNYVVIVNEFQHDPAGSSGRVPAP
jgi:hypothetical protein